MLNSCISRTKRNWDDGGDDALLWRFSSTRTTTTTLSCSHRSSSDESHNEKSRNGIEMQSSSSAIDGDPVRQRSRVNQTTTTTTHNNHHDYSSRPVPTKDDDSDKDLATSSVTHWSSIMRQESWLDAGENATTALLLDSVLSDADLAMIEDFWDHRLMPTVSYLGTEVVAKIYKALCVAYRAHRGQMRKSGEPFIIHVSTVVSRQSVSCLGDGAVVLVVLLVVVVCCSILWEGGG